MYRQTLIQSVKNKKIFFLNSKECNAVLREEDKSYKIPNKSREGRKRVGDKKEECQGIENGYKFGRYSNYFNNHFKCKCSEYINKGLALSEWI